MNDEERDKLLLELRDKVDNLCNALGVGKVRPADVISIRDHAKKRIAEHDKKFGR
jgi:hypothetical protein